MVKLMIKLQNSSLQLAIQLDRELNIRRREDPSSSAQSGAPNSRSRSSNKSASKKDSCIVM